MISICIKSICIFDDIDIELNGISTDLYRISIDYVSNLYRLYIYFVYNTY